MKFLQSRNLSVKQESLFISFISEGFQFLNWRFYYINCFFIGIPSSNLIKAQKSSLNILIKNSNNVNISWIIKNINLQIDSWIYSCSFLNFYWDLSNELDVFLYRLLWRWAKRRHPRRNNTWIYSKYWSYLFGKWRFFVKDIINGKVLLIKSHLYYKSRIFRVPNSINVFDISNKPKVNDIWFKKIRKNFKGICSLLYNNQKGLCPICNRLIFSTSFNDFRVLRKKKKSGSTTIFISNLILIHNYCELQL